MCEKCELNLFDEGAWSTKCDALGRSAQAGCGLVYELFEANFSAAVDSAVEQLPEQHRARALEIAADHGYATQAQREETRKMLDESGCCAHGLDPDCCPCGCGDLDSGDFEDD